VGVRDSREMDDDVRLDRREERRKRLIVTRIENVNRNTRCMQVIEPLVNEVKVERAVADVVGVAGEGGEIVDLQAVDDLDLGAELLQGQRHVMADEPGAAGDEDTSAGDFV